MARNNILIDQIYAAGPTAFNNNFDCYLLQETAASSKSPGEYSPIEVYDQTGKTKIIDHRIFATRIEKITIPSLSLSSGEISYGNEKIAVAGSKLETENKSKITVRMDANLYLLGMLNTIAGTSMTSDVLNVSNTNITFGSFVAYTNLYRPRLTFIVRRGSQYQFTDAQRAGTEASSLFDANRKDELVDRSSIDDPDTASNPGLLKGSFRSDYDPTKSATQMNQFAVFEDVRFCGTNDIGLSKQSGTLKMDYEFIFKHLSFEKF